MPAYTVVLPSGAYTLQDGNNAVVVIAGNTDDAKAQAQAFTDGDGAPWDQATVTEIVEDADLADLRITVTIEADADNGFDNDVVVSYDTLGTTADDTVDEIGAALVAALNAHADLADVTYTAGSDLVTIVAANNCGASAITATVSKQGVDGQWFVVSDFGLVVSAEGVAASDRTITITDIGTGVNPAFVCGYKA